MARYFRRLACSSSINSSLTGSQRSVLFNRNAIFPIWQIVIVRCPISAGATVVFRLRIHSRKFFWWFGLQYNRISSGLTTDFRILWGRDRICPRLTHISPTSPRKVCIPIRKSNARSGRYRKTFYKSPTRPATGGIFVCNRHKSV